MPNLGKKGYDQGSMSPVVENCQKPASNFSQADFMKTNEYISRQDKFVAKEAGAIKKQDYKGRYS